MVKKGKLSSVIFMGMSKPVQIINVKSRIFMLQLLLGQKFSSALSRVIASIKSRKAKRESTPVEDSQVFPVTNETTASSNLPVGERRGDIEEAEALARSQEHCWSQKTKNIL
ncbi:uncharacterized protein A4U43_C04F22520 [Asparagus officinalis]|uniref:Uncharacterized protein n=1 Tax=Asparagus officinalis TaxID=4686 RepID=A0A5P1F2Z3_ASPOF|nr:uncharacterized protein A4U43_C04F22520 [Asparagus officinalis]